MMNATNEIYFGEDIFFRFFFFRLCTVLWRNLQKYARCFYMGNNYGIHFLMNLSVEVVFYSKADT